MLTKGDKVLIISHYTFRVDTTKGIGPPQDLKNFLVGKVGTLTYLEFPFPYANDTKYYTEHYVNGTRVSQQAMPLPKCPDWLQYFLQVFVILFLSFRTGPHTVCFALDNLSALSVLPLRFFRRITTLVYYSIDYTPQRFKNRILNAIYQKADAVACSTADINWVLSVPMRRAKQTRNFFTGKPARFQEVPMGFPKKEIAVLPLEKIDRFHLVFAGILVEKQGVQLVLNACPVLKKIFPKMRLTIIGSGDYEKTLQQIARGNNLMGYVTFKGFMENHREIEYILTRAGIGLAPYAPDPKSYTYFADPMKPKIYIGCGLPVVITDVPPIARKLQKGHAGIIMQYSKKGIIEAIGKILKDKNTYASFRKSAIEMSGNFDTGTILERAASRIS